MKNLTEINKKRKFLKVLIWFFFHSIIGNKRIDLNDTDKIIDKLKLI